MQLANNIALWLNRSPNGAERVVVVYVGLAEETIWTVPRAELGTSSMDAAAALMTVIQEDCDGRCERSSYRLQWEDTNGLALGSKPVKAMPMHGDGQMTAESGRIGEEHPYVQMLAHVFRSKDSLLKSNLTSTGNALKAQQELITSLMGFCTTLMRARVAEYAVAGEESETSGGGGTALDEAKAVALDRAGQAAAEHLIPVLGRLAEKHGDKLLSSSAERVSKAQDRAERAMRKTLPSKSAKPAKAKPAKRPAAATKRRSQKKRPSAS